MNNPYIDLKPLIDDLGTSSRVYFEITGSHPAIDGFYDVWDTTEGRFRWANDSAAPTGADWTALRWNANRWELGTYTAFTTWTPLYYNPSPADIPPATGWRALPAVTDPSPTLAWYSQSASLETLGLHAEDARLQEAINSVGGSNTAAIQALSENTTAALDLKADLIDGTVPASQLPPVSYQTTRHEGDGTTTAFQPPGTLTASDSPSALSVTINGVVQEPSVDYTLDVENNRIVLDAPLPAGDKIVITRPILLPSASTLSAEQLGAASASALTAESLARAAADSALQAALDAKASTSHKSSHATGGSDALTPSDIGALWRPVVFSQNISGNTTLPAGRNRIITLLGTGATANVDLPGVGNEEGDSLVLLTAFFVPSNFTIRRPSGSPPFTNLVTFTGSNQSASFYFANGSWNLRRVDFHTHAIADTTGLQTALDGKVSNYVHPITGEQSNVAQAAMELRSIENGTTLGMRYDSTVETIAEAPGGGIDDPWIVASPTAFRAAIGAARATSGGEAPDITQGVVDQALQLWDNANGTTALRISDGAVDFGPYATQTNVAANFRAAISAASTSALSALEARVAALEAAQSP